MTKPRGGGFVHDALFYADNDLVRSASSFLRQGLDAGERVVMVCTVEHSASLLRALDNDERVITLDQRGVYRCSAAAISQYQAFMESEGTVGGRRVRLVGEIDFGDELDTWQEWENYESVVNRYLAPYDIRAMCLYNTRELPEQVLRAGLLTHPNVSDAWGRRSNRLYQPPDRFLRTHARPMSSSGGPRRTVWLDTHQELAGLRSSVASAAVELGLPARAIDDFVCSVNELAANATTHGQPPVQISVTRQPQRIVCDVTDQGAGFDDPFTGYAPQARHRHDAAGRGLWLVRQMCHHLDFGRTEDGFVVRVAMDLPEEH